jgi:hypothetical protein
MASLYSELAKLLEKMQGFKTACLLKQASFTKLLNFWEKIRAFVDPGSLIFGVWGFMSKYSRFFRRIDLVCKFDFNYG